VNPSSRAPLSIRTPIPKQDMYHVGVRPRRRAPLALGLAAVTLVLLHAPGLAGGRTPFLRDLLSHHLGWRLQWADQVRAGILPLEEPLLDGGLPLAANPNAGALYPATVLFLVLAPPVALTLHLLLHHVILLLGAARLARAAGAPRRTAATAAIALAGSGLAFSQAAFLNASAAWAWAPWIVAAGAATPSRRRTAAAAALGALQWLAGEPVIAALTWALWLAAVLLRSGGRPRELAAAAPAPLLAAALAAPLLLPAARVLAVSRRAAMPSSPAAVAADAFRPQRWPELVLPRFLGPPAPPGPEGSWAASSLPWQRYELSLHVGTVALLLLALGLGRRPGWAVLAAGWAALAALPGVVTALARVLPALAGFRYAIKLLLPAAVAAVPVLAAGASRARHRPRAFRRLAAATLAALVPVAAVSLDATRTAAVLGRLYPASAATLRRPEVAAAVSRRLRADVALAALPLAAAAADPARLLLPALAVQAVLGSRWPLAWDRWSAWSDPPPLARRLGPGARVWVDLPVPSGPVTGRDPVAAHYRRMAAALLPLYGERFGISYRAQPSPDGLEPAWVAAAAARMRGAADGERLMVARHLGIEWILVPRSLPGGPSGVERIATRAGGQPVVLHRLPDPAPAAWLAERVIAVPSEAAAWRQLADPATRPGRDAVVTGAAGVERPGGGTVRVTVRRPGRWEVAVEAVRPGLLVLDTTPGPLWRVSVDGAPASQVRVDLCRLGVRVSAGSHRVLLTADRRPLVLGLLLALAAAAVTGTLAATPTPGRRPPTGGAEPTPRATAPAP